MNHSNFTEILTWIEWRLCSNPPCLEPSAQFHGSSLTGVTSSPHHCAQLALLPASLPGTWCAWAAPDTRQAMLTRRFRYSPCRTSPMRVQRHNGTSACIALLCNYSHLSLHFLRQLSLASPFLPPQGSFSEISWFTVAQEALCLGLARYVLHWRGQPDSEPVNLVIKYTENLHLNCCLCVPDALYSRSQWFMSFDW